MTKTKGNTGFLGGNNGIDEYNSGGETDNFRDSKSPADGSNVTPRRPAADSKEALPRTVIFWDVHQPEENRS